MAHGTADRLSRSPRRRFQPVPDGIQVALPDDEGEILVALLDQFRELLVVDDDPNLSRLKPVARPDDPEADQAYAEMVGDELLRNRLESIDRVETDIGGGILDEEGTTAWLQTINGLRLVLGERLDVTEDPTSIDVDDPEAAAHAVYEWLGWLLDDLVRAASGDLPPGTGGDA